MKRMRVRRIDRGELVNQYVEEVRVAVKRMKSGKAGGPDVMEMPQREDI